MPPFDSPALVNDPGVVDSLSNSHRAAAFVFIVAVLACMGACVRSIACFHYNTQLRQKSKVASVEDTLFLIEEDEASVDHSDDECLGSQGVRSACTGNAHDELQSSRRSDTTSTALD